MAGITPETVRGWQFDQLRKGLLIMRSVLNTIPTQDTTTLRDGGTGWTVLEVLCHLRDYEVIFLERARLTVEGDRAVLPNPDPDALAVERRYNEGHVEAAYQEWVARRETFLAYLSTLDEAAWSRLGEHPRRGLISLQDQLALIAWHDTNHLEQIVHIVAEGKTA